MNSAAGGAQPTTMKLKEYFARISYKGPLRPLDLKTLTAVLQHHIRAVPFENLNIHCGETIELGLEAVYKKIVKNHRGGWCLENNLLLSWVLQTMGYDVTLLGSYVYVPQENKYDDGMNHLLLKVVIDGKAYAVDGGFGIAFQMWQPVELISGKEQPQKPGIFRVTEDNGTWYFDKLKRKVYSSDPENKSLYFDGPEDLTCKKIFAFTLKPRSIEEFREQNTALQTAPDSLFVKKSICSLQTANGFQVLIGWTLTEAKYDYKDNMDLIEKTTLTDEEVEKTLKERFNIRLKKKLVPCNESLVPTS
ncbi:arylamine N-acetyltransferase, pineal gland isozyme NAT-3-like isoform X1 [Sphaerodactylus townsendi]|uniref:arylamine N-acetyltransferase, pineal gland isozyme NAT-3-like isoform X1 n=1 Tax=Sphaerodactylus townsendi TaxID=933632 RepID=UPI002025E2B3|nr:arylamine N-acetyltransferase, pineal gland isozyme NAT-3-like isoform X1 [Sphaerodactylus townsendi]